MEEDKEENKRQKVYKEELQMTENQWRKDFQDRGVENITMGKLDK